jgi:hypothetical protein
MSADALSAHGTSRGADFYVTALTYGHYLWLRGFVGRAVLKLDRAFAADVDASHPILKSYPPPYEAVAWMLVTAPASFWNGNPRVHFQHLADRVRGPRAQLRSWRAWACWAIVREACPNYSGDPAYHGIEPSLRLIADGLAAHGISGEPEIWRTALGFASGGRDGSLMLPVPLAENDR